MEVVETGLVDPSQFDPESPYFDPRSNREQPRWDCVRLAYRGRFAQLLSLDELRSSYSVEELAVVRRGNRLSILPVADAIAARLLGTLGPVQA